MTGSGLSRRQLLLASGAVLGGVASVGPAQAATGDADEPFSAARDSLVSGVIVAIDLPATLELDGSDGRVLVEFDDVAFYWRDHPAKLSDFTQGEAVVVEGTWRDSRFLGRSLINVYQVVNGSVLEGSGNEIRTSAGKLRLVPETRRQNGTKLEPVDPSRVAPGTDITALGRVDPNSSELVALRLYGT